MKARTWTTLLALAPLALAACNGDSTGSKTNGQVAIRFGVTTGASANRLPDGPLGALSAGPLTITGANGTLTVSSINVVIGRLKLKGSDGSACANDSSSRDDNEHEAGECEFKAGPFFTSIPLDGTDLAVATSAVPPGTYTRVRFKLKNLDFRDDDDHEDDDTGGQQATADLFNQIRSQFPDWPAKATMRVVGTFTPTGGTARNFTAYLNAEVKLDLPINPPLVVTDSSTATSVSVKLDPAAFFKSGSNVIDLSQFGASNVGDFKVEAENGFHGEGHEHD